MKSEPPQDLGIAQALGKIPSGLFILTASHEERRAGMLISWVQQVGFSPPMVSLAVAKGKPILPLMSESKKFGLCQMAEGEKIILRKFATHSEINEDPFLGFEMQEKTKLHVPILKNVLAYMECEITCHIDVNSDHDIFVGHILHAKLNPGEPCVHLRTNGFKY